MSDYDVGGRVLVVHDYFAIKGGGERVALLLGNHFHADLLCGFITPDSFDLSSYKGGRIFTLFDSPPRAGFRTWQLFLAFRSWAKQHDCSVYKHIIFSGIPCLGLAWSYSGTKIVYCHTPPRYLFGVADGYMRQFSAPIRLGLAVARPLLRKIYSSSLLRCDKVIANSEHVARKLFLGCCIKASVVYPPVDIDGFTEGSDKDYYLSTARHTKAKRVALIVEAFKRMPLKRLIVVSQGPETIQLVKAASEFKNIIFRGNVSDNELKDFVRNCKAVIYVPFEEDFGISAVEAQAAGKPVIYTNSGGLPEAIQPVVGGMPIDEPLTAGKIMAALLELETSRNMVDAAIQREHWSQRFSISRFIYGFGVAAEMQSR